MLILQVLTNYSLLAVALKDRQCLDFEVRPCIIAYCTMSDRHRFLPTDTNAAKACFVSASTWAELQGSNTEQAAKEYRI